MAVPRPGRTRAAIWIVIGGLLAAVLIGTLWVPFYNHLTPALGEFPFFYWYQLMWVPIVAILSGIAYLLSRLAQRGSRPPEATASGGAPDNGRRTGGDELT
jgi:membrane protein implicated in regulation of membrane protease activity